MRAVQTLAMLSIVGAGAALSGCSATGLTQDAYAITKAECQATITHLSKTEPEFDGLVYDNSGEVIGYSRHARVNVGLGYWGEYADFVIFFPDEASLENFQQGGWSLGGQVAGGILGLGASGMISMTEDVTFVSDPRASGGLGAFFTVDNFSYNDIDTALSSN